MGHATPPGRRAPRFAAAAIAAALLVSCGGSSDEGSAPTSSPVELGTRPDEKRVYDDVVTPEIRKKALALPANATIPADANVKGMFGELFALPLIPVHAVLTADGRMLHYGTDTTGRQTGSFNYAVWNPLDGTSETLANGTGTDIFCSSQVLLPGGDQVFIAGGDNWTGSATTNTGNNNSNLFTVASNTLTRQNNMNRARWYSTSTTLLNGETYIQGGSSGGDRPEVRQANGTFRLLSTTDTSGLAVYFPRNFIAPDGRVFGYDGAGRMYYVNPGASGGTGSITMAGQFTSSVTGDDATAAMFAPGRILQVGGASASAIVIDINGASPTVTTTASMQRQRKLANATILPTGRVLVTGGSSVWNALTNVSYEAEIWNPTTGTWTVGASGAVPRLYHSVGLLLPDATVLVAGGGAPGPYNNRNGEIYYPPYLFTSSATLATRPVIGTAPTVTDPGRTLKLSFSHSSGRPVQRVTLVKTGSVTHSFNMDQRFVELPFTVSGNQISAQVPARASDVPPGMWMVFVIDDAGVPSEAKLLRMNVAPALNTSVTPVLNSPGNQSATLGAAVNLAVSASDPNGDALTYAASGLPPGLSINPTTGAITGTPNAAGSYSVVLTVSDGYNSASTSLTWQVNGNTGLSLTQPTAPAPASSGTSTTFIASASGVNVRYSWNFGDGSPATAWSTSGSVDKTYSAPGIYTVTVTVTDDSSTQQTRSLLHQVFLPATATAPSISSAIVFEPRSGANPRLWVVNPDNDSVSVFDAVTRARLAEVVVGTAPRALAIAPDGAVWVTNKASASISVISASTLAVTRTIALARGSMPFGIAMMRTATSALVALEGSGQLVKISTTGFNTTGTLGVGQHARHVAVAADGSTAFVSRFITPPISGEATAAPSITSGGGELLQVNAGAMTLTRTLTLASSTLADAENQGRGLPNYLGAAAISPDGTQAFVPSKLDNIFRGGTRDGQALNFQSTVRAVSSRLTLGGTPAASLAERVDHDNASMASAAAFDPLGVYLFVALETSREVVVMDAHRRSQVLRIDTGRAPQALVVSPDRKTLYVQNFMDRSVGVYDLTPLTEQALASVPLVTTLNAVGTEKLTATVLKGKQFFYDARDPRLARDRYMSCASCHNDGGHDGRVWDLKSQGEGLRNTISLRGRAGAQGRLHWSNNFNEVHDFEGQIRALAGGTGLMTDTQFNTGTRSQPLGDAKAGVSADLDALAAYVASLNAFDVSPNRPGAGSLSSAAAAGRNVFIAQNCGSCHSGSAFTRASGDNPANVGTLKSTSGQRLGGTLSGIDVPTLRDVWMTAPYLHDGSAATLDAAVQAHTGIAITSGDLGNLVAYLRELGSDEGNAPVPATSGAGLVSSYFNNMTLSGTAVLTRTEAVNFDWGNGTPGIGVNANQFSVRWTGTVTIPTSGSYRFRTNSDDGVRLWVNGTQRINNWTDHAPTLNTSTTLSFSAGQRISITLEYYENGGGAVMQLQWLTPGASSYVAIPASRLNTN